MSESILDISGLGLDDTFEPTVVPAGSEHKLRIVSFTSGTDKRDYNYIMPFFEVLEDPYCKEFGDYIALPNESMMSVKELNDSKLHLSSFLEAFGITGTQIDFKEEVGNEGWAILGMGKDQQGEPQNTINNYIAGQ